MSFLKGGPSDTPSCNHSSSAIGGFDVTEHVRLTSVPSLIGSCLSIFTDSCGGTEKKRQGNYIISYGQNKISGMPYTYYKFPFENKYKYMFDSEDV